MAGKEPLCRSAFKNIAAKKMTIKEINKENKENKETKKDFKELLKVNKEMFEEMIKSNKENSSKVENQIGAIGPAIATSVGNEMKNTVQDIFTRMKDMFKDQINTKPAEESAIMNVLEKEEDRDMFLSNEPIIEKENNKKNVKVKVVKKRSDHNVSKNEDESKEETDVARLHEKIELQDQKIDLLMNEIDKLKVEVEDIKKVKNYIEEINVKESGESSQNSKNKTKIKELKPALVIDEDGNEDKDTTRLENQPIDWTEVVLPKRRWEKRPSLSDTLNEKVNVDLAKQFEEKYRGETKVKTKPQKEMSHQQRQSIIQSMLQKSGLMVGVGPITMEHIKNVEKLLVKNGVLNISENAKSRLQRTVKSIVKGWAKRNLSMEDRDWDSLQIQNIVLTDNSDIVFVNCKSQNDATQLTSRAKNLPKENNTNSPRMMMHVDRRAMKRHKAILAIAKSVRLHSNNTVQTTVRTGKSDFLLRQRPKGSTTPWSEIPPMKISQEIPEFEVGKYKDLVNPDNNIEDDMNEDEEDNKDDAKDPLGG